MPRSKLPVIVLVRPQMGENIGAVARAMSNFGLAELRVVHPRGGWPNAKALEMASNAAPIIEAAKCFPDTPSALADIQIAFGTSARPRDMEKRVIEPREAMGELKAQMGEGIRTAILFGPERTGLENDDIALCDTLVTIPTTKNASLNIAQSAVVMLYEWQMCQEQYLDEADFVRAAHKKPIMWQNLRNTLLRARMSEQEIRTFRGMLRVLWEGRLPRKK
jgi:tRNA/rRNA methyltransferase